MVAILGLQVDEAGQEPATLAHAATETDLVHQCLEVLRSRGAFCWRQNSGAMRRKGRDGKSRLIRFCSALGVADVVGVLPGGRFVSVECKRPGNVPSDDQREFLNAVNRRGGLALLVYDAVDLSEIIDRELGQTQPNNRRNPAATAEWDGEK